MIVQSAMSGTHGQVAMPARILAVGATWAVVSLILLISWLAISVGLLKIAPWAISFGKKLAPVHILLLVLSLAVSLVFVAPETKKMAEQQFEAQRQSQNSKNPPPPAVAKGFAVGMAYGGPIIGFLIGMILPTTMLIALGRPSVKIALDKTLAAAGGYPPA
jgi:hypothetical protein